MPGPTPRPCAIRGTSFQNFQSSNLEACRTRKFRIDREFRIDRLFNSRISAQTGGGGRFGATASAARIVFSHINDSRVNTSNAMRPAHAVAPNLAPPPEERRPVSELKPLYQWKYRRCRRGAPPCPMQIADYSGVFFIFVPRPARAARPPRILERTIHGESTVY